MRRFAGLTVLLAAVAGGQTPQLVADVETAPDDSNPNCFVTLGPTTFFTARTPAGTQLWRVDGAGVRQVSNINPGTYAVGSCPTALGSAVFFAANDGLHGWELWRSDGTTAGTAMVLDIAPGPASGLDTFARPAVVGNKLAFKADDGVHGAEPWVSDGTAAGTVMLGDLYPGSNGSSPGLPPTRWTARMFFNAATPDAGDEPWITDGTAAGTRMIADLCPGTCSTGASNFNPLDGGALFFANVNNLPQPWFTDGTAAGTGAVGPVSPNALFPSVVELSGTLLFPFTDVAHGTELWKSDGTAAGTMLVADLNPGPASSNPYWMVVTGGKAFVIALNGMGAQTLYTSDGTAPGTVAIKAMAPPKPFFGWSIGALGSQAFFDWVTAAAPSVHELWATDGSPAGTALVASFNDPFVVAITGSALHGLPYFTGLDPAHGLELWRTDGTPAGTGLVADINTASKGSTPAELVAFHGGVAFSASTADAGSQIWVTDGTVAGTRMLSAPWPVYPYGLTVSGSRLFYSGNGATKTGTLWSSDGTPAGTAPVPGARPDFYPIELVDFSGVLLMTTGDGTDEIWRSDGITASRVIAMCPTNPPEELTPVGGLTFFRGDDCNTGRELWVTDGTGAGTRLLADIVPGAFESYPENFTASGGLLYFSPEGAPSGDELWRSDGTDAGTFMLRDLNPGAAGSFPYDFVPFGDGGLWFSATVDGGRQLWRTDGTAAGTQQAAALDGGGAPVAMLGDALIFERADSLHGNELWRLDDAGAQLVADLQPGPASGNAGDFVHVGSLLYFTANDGLHGTELWRTDGTTDGTQLVVDLSPGARASTPSGLALSGDRLFFSADDGQVGFEPWMLPLQHGVTRWLVITSPPRTVPAGACSPPVTVEARDDFGARVVGPGTSLSLSTGSMSLSFFSDAQCTSSATATALDASGVATFFFRDSTPGAPAVIVTPVSGRGAQQTETVAACMPDAGVTCRTVLPAEQAQAFCARAFVRTPAVALRPGPFTLAEAPPDGLALDAQGTLTWTPSRAQAGAWTLHVLGADSEQDVVVSVDCTRASLSAGCGCGAGGGALLPLALALALLRRQRR